MDITKHSVINFTSQVIVFIFSLITGIVLARTLGPEGKGVYFLAFMIATTGVDVVRSSIPVAGVYYIGTKKYRFEDLIINFIFLAIFLGLIGIALVLFFFKPISLYLLKDINPFYVKIALLFIPLSLLIAFLSWALLGLNDILRYNLINIIRALSVTIFVSLVCLFWSNVLLCIIANLAACGVAIIAVLILLSGYIKKDGRLSLPLIKDVLFYGWKAHLGDIFFHVINRLDSYLVMFFLGAGFLGYYSVALVAEHLWIIPMSIGTALFPKVSSSLLEDKNKDTAAVCRNAVFLTFSAAFIFLIFSMPFVKILYGDAFLPAVVPLCILLPGAASLSISKTLKAYLSGVGKPQIATYSSMATILVCIFLNLMLIPKMGIVGAALATTSSYFIYAIIILIAFLKVSGNNLTDTIIIKKQDLLIYQEVILEGYRFISKRNS